MKPITYRYSKDGHGWYVAFLDSIGCMSVQSDYGDYSYRWSNFGDKDFREWILTPNDHYLMSKFSQGKREFDSEATFEAVEEFVRNASEWDEELPSKYDSEEEWREYFIQCEIPNFQENTGGFWKTRMPQQLVAFMTHVFPLIRADIRKELAKEEQG